ncbi:MAG: OmpA family protein [Rhodospirillales bacterium]|nr:OmpA family protein [Rhodospirillales bacterium]
MNPRGQMIVGKVAYVVQNDPTARVTVIGRTDRIGAPPANLALSQRRANAVRDALVAAGVPADRIDTSWTGEPTQGAPPSDAVDPRNRVVDVTVVKQPG